MAEVRAVAVAVAVARVAAARAVAVVARAVTVPKGGVKEGACAQSYLIERVLPLTQHALPVDPYPPALQVPERGYHRPRGHRGRCSPVHQHQPRSRLSTSAERVDDTTSRGLDEAITR